MSTAPTISSFKMPPRAPSGVVGQRGSKYPLGDLRAGTDDAIVLEDLDPKKAHSKLSSAVANYRKQVKAAGGTPGTYSIRTFELDVTAEDGSVTKQTRVGVWRTA